MARYHFMCDDAKQVEYEICRQLMAVGYFLEKQAALQLALRMPRLLSKSRLVRSNHVGLDESQRKQFGDLIVDDVDLLAKPAQRRVHCFHA